MSGQPSNYKRKLFVSKELGDRMQIFCHMVMVKLNPDDEVILIDELLKHISKRLLKLKQKLRIFDSENYINPYLKKFLEIN